LCGLSVTRKLITDIAAEGRIPKTILGVYCVRFAHSSDIFPDVEDLQGWTYLHISIHVLKYALATLIEGVASALRHQLLEHTSHCFYSIHQIFQPRKLPLVDNKCGDLG
jgi:hypothetical protein